jgi:hypothetical protein
MRTFIERVTPDRYFPRKLQEWKAMRREGWELTALVEERFVRGRKTVVSVVAFGYALDEAAGVGERERDQFAARPEPEET